MKLAENSSESDVNIKSVNFQKCWTWKGNNLKQIVCHCCGSKILSPEMVFVAFQTQTMKKESNLNCDIIFLGSRVYLILRAWNWPTPWSSLHEFLILLAAMCCKLEEAILLWQWFPTPGEGFSNWGGTFPSATTVRLHLERENCFALPRAIHPMIKWRVLNDDDDEMSGEFRC